jgi:hypothetical protein
MSNEGIECGGAKIGFHSKTRMNKQLSTIIKEFRPCKFEARGRRNTAHCANMTLLSRLMERLELPVENARVKRVKPV